MQIADIKENDTIIVKGTGVSSMLRRRYIVTRVTKTQIKARLVFSDNPSEFTFSRKDGTQLPRDSAHVDWSIAFVNGLKVS